MHPPSTTTSSMPPSGPARPAHTPARACTARAQRRECEGAARLCAQARSHTRAHPPPSLQSPTLPFPFPGCKTVLPPPYPLPPSPPPLLPYTTPPTPRPHSHRSPPYQHSPSPTPTGTAPPATPNPVSPTIHCCQFMERQYQMQNGPLFLTAVSPPTPPEAQHLSAHDDELVANPKLFIRGQLHFHTAAPYFHSPPSPLAGPRPRPCPGLARVCGGGGWEGGG